MVKKKMGAKSNSRGGDKKKTELDIKNVGHWLLQL